MNIAATRHPRPSPHHGVSPFKRKKHYDLVISLMSMRAYIKASLQDSQCSSMAHLYVRWSAVQGEIDILIVLILSHFRAQPWGWYKLRTVAGRRKLHFRYHEPG
jgi:hypothetical protein